MGPAIDNRRQDSPAHLALPTARGGCLSAWWALVRFGLCVFLLALIASLLVTPWLHLAWWTVFRRCVSIAAAISLWLWTRKIERRPWKAYGLAWDRAGKRQLFAGLLLGVTALGLMLGLHLLMGTCRIDVTPDRFKLWRTVLGFIPAALLVSVLEELVFRGVVFQRLLACSTPLALFTSSGLYALVHLRTMTPTVSTWLELVGLFVLGSVLALCYLVTRRLTLAIGLHAAFAYGARVNKLLIEFTDPSLAWLVGTNRLVNGVIHWFVLLGMGGLVIWWARGSWRGGTGNEIGVGRSYSA